jgi:hypothetical protein
MGVALQKCDVRSHAMSNTPDFDAEDEGGSPPCFLHELGRDGAPFDPQQARDVARWR